MRHVLRKAFHVRSNLRRLSIARLQRREIEGGKSENRPHGLRRQTGGYELFLRNGLRLPLELVEHGVHRGPRRFADSQVLEQSVQQPSITHPGAHITRRESKRRHDLHGH